MNWEQIKSLKKEHKSSPGKISCSSLPTIALCGGSYEANSKVESVERPCSEEGTALHYCMEHNLIPDGLPEELLEKMQFAKSAIGFIESQGWERLEVEKFLENERLCGSPDVIFKRGKTEYLILDFKFGWEWVADNSSQVLGYAELVTDEYVCTQVYTCIVQPEKDNVNIMEVDMVEAKIVTDHIIANKDEGKRIPSQKACQFCDACGTFACPETQKISHSLTAPELSSKEISIEDIKKHAHLIPIMTKALSGFKSQVEKYMNEGGIVDGVSMKEGHALYDVNSLPKTISRLSEHIPSQDILKACKLSAKAVKDLLYEHKVCLKKDSKDKMIELLGDALTEKITKPSLRFDK